jgi:hypothetical protein
MISIDFNTWNGYQFGNKLLGLNNLIQISNYYNHEYDYNHFNGLELFEIPKSQNNHIMTNTQNLTADLFLKTDKDKITLDDNTNYVLQPCLLELFDVFNSVSTFDIFTLKKNDIVSDEVLVGIHFRGTDFKLWDDKAILSFEYYKESIDFIKNEIKENFIFVILTDDKDLASYKLTLDYLSELGLSYKLGDINDFKEDFYLLSQCDYIISTPSTFCIAASFCGKKNKKIIHNRWFVVDYKNSSDYFRDIFWKNLITTNNNNNYKLYKLI